MLGAIVLFVLILGLALTPFLLGLKACERWLWLMYRYPMLRWLSAIAAVIGVGWMMVWMMTFPSFP
jgi:hypothetical protein